LTAVLCDAILRATVVAIRGACPGSARGEAAEASLHQRARPVRQPRGSLALCLAVLLALMPAAERFPTLTAQAALALAAAFHAPDEGAPRGAEPALGPQDHQPDAGVLPRLLHLDGALAAPPKAAFPTLHGSREWLVAPRAAGTRSHAARDDFHHSSIGTARQPTGPPA
jgi:hypothetical protein